MISKKNSVVVHYLEMKRMNPLEDQSVQFIKRLAAKIYIPA